MLDALSIVECLRLKLLADESQTVLVSYSVKLPKVNSQSESPLSASFSALPVLVYSPPSLPIFHPPCLSSTLSVHLPSFSLLHPPCLPSLLLHPPYPPSPSLFTTLPVYPPSSSTFLIYSPSSSLPPTKPSSFSMPTSHPTHSSHIPPLSPSLSPHLLFSREPCL